MSELIKEILNGTGNFLHKYIQPFLAPFFTILNYISLTKGIKNTNSFWVIFFLFTTIVYLIISLGFAIYQVLKNSGLIE